MKKILPLCCVSLLLQACASTYEPIIDHQWNDEALYQQDLAECRQLAEQAHVTDDTTTNTLVGAGIGALIGGISGSFSGNVGSGMIIGGSTGAAGGAASGVTKGVNQKKSIVRNCLTGRGYTVLN